MKVAQEATAAAVSQLLSKLIQREDEALTTLSSMPRTTTCAVNLRFCQSGALHLTALDATLTMASLPSRVLLALHLQREEIHWGGDRAQSPE